MKSGSRRVGEHVEHIKFLLVGVLGHLVGVILYPLLVPFLLDFSEIVFHSCMSLFFLLIIMRCSLSYAKVVQTERITSSLLECFAEVQPILCKGSDFLHRYEIEGVKKAPVTCCSCRFRRPRCCQSFRRFVHRLQSRPAGRSCCHRRQRCFRCQSFRHQCFRRQCCCRCRPGC